MKKLFSVAWRFAFIWLLTACAVGPLLQTQRPPEPSKREERRVTAFLQEHPEWIKAHPELFPRDTVRIKVPFVVPRVEFKKEFVLVHDTVYLERESRQLDSLILGLEASLSLAQRQATAAKLHQLLDNRPVLRDTLRADTLGVSVKVWLEGRRYQLSVIRDSIQGETVGEVVTGGLDPCPSLPAPVSYPWYNPAGWPWAWWAWLLFGASLGSLLTCLIGRAVASYLLHSRQW